MVKDLMHIRSRVVPVKVGKEVVSSVRQNFRSGGFYGAKWKTAKRQQVPFRGAAGTNGPLLSKTNHLMSSTDYDAGERLPCAIDTKPEVRYLVVIFKIPGVEFFSGVYVEQIGDFHCGRLFEERNHLVQTVSDKVKEHIHQLGFLHFRDIDNGSFTLASKPTGFGVSAATTWKNQDAGVGPFKCLNVVGELLLCSGTLHSFTILVHAPIHIVWIYVRPMESARSLRRIAEVINLVACLSESVHDI